MLSLRRIMLILLTFCDVRMSLVAGEAGKTTIDNGVVKLVLVNDGKQVKESYYARSPAGWRLVLENGSMLRPDPSLKASGTGTSKARVHVIEKSSQQTHVVLKVQSGKHSLTKTITMKNDDPFVRIVLRDAVRGTSRIEYYLSTYSFVPDGKQYSEYKPLDFVFTPQLRPEGDEVIADHTFRSPALMMQEGDVCAALIPDIRSIDGKNRRLKSSADMQVETSPAPFMSFGLMNWVRKKAHVYYAHTDSLAVNINDTTVSCGYYLYISAVAPPQRGFQNVVRFEWSQFGNPNFEKPTGPQSQPFSVYVRKAWEEYLPRIVLTTQYRGKQVTLLRQARLAWSNSLPAAANDDCWFNVWFNSLRTAYGMFVYGQEVGNTELMGKAVGTLDLALLAPQRSGIAPSIFYADSSGGHWIADHAWGGISHGEHLSAFHNSWTNYWLLQWSDVLPARKDEILQYATRFAEFLAARQHVSGVVPSWYDSLTLAPIETFRNTNAETAGAALFLAEIYSRTHHVEYLHAAEKAMEYIFTSIVPENKWYDFETFFSCSRKPEGFFDYYTQQHPQNTLSMFMAAEACYTLYRLTNEPRYKETGVSLMDYICLYQQVWSPEWLSRELLGGFGVQNTDGEWSDSRQGYFAVTLMNYYELTKRREYFERGVAALRAMFSLFESDDSPRTAENYAHGSFDQLAGVTGIHWGTGSSVVSSHLIRRRYGDAFINVREGWGCGIDGCRFDDVVVSGNEIRFSLRDVVRSPRQILLKFGESSAQTYSVSMNGRRLGEYSAAQLPQGILVQI